MTQSADAPAPPAPSSAIANLAGMLLRPRETMRRILDQPRDRMIVPLLLLGMISGFLSDYDLGALVQLLRRPPTPYLPLIILGGVLGSAAFLFLFFLGFAWLVAYLGRRLEGTGNPKGMRSAIAWGLAPIIWGLLFRVPVSLYFAFGTGSYGKQKVDLDGSNVIVDAGLFSHGCAWGAALVCVEIAILFWWLAATSVAIGEAHRFSGWQGFGTLLLALAVPLLLILSLVIAGMF